MKKILGITGGIASGKSTLSRLLAGKGFYIIDADKISRDILKEGERAYYEVRREFADCFSEEKLNRKKLGSIVFSDKNALKKLNAITHPEIVSKIKTLTEAFEGLCVIDAALLFETHLDELCDEVWCVFAPKDERIKRICNRDGLSPKEAEMRINSQTDDETIKAKSIAAFDTSVPYELYLKKVNSELERFLKE